MDGRTERPGKLAGLQRGGIWGGGCSGSVQDSSGPETIPMVAVRWALEESHTSPGLVQPLLLSQSRAGLGPRFQGRST